MNCPTCNNLGSKTLDWRYSGIKNSIFNYTAEYCHCSNCGLVWVNNINDETLSKFYKDECTYFMNTHFDIENKANIEKFTYYNEILNTIGMSNNEVVDIGCGRGGFLNWLSTSNPDQQNFGIDVDLKSLPSDTRNTKYLEGSALSIPFSDHSRKVLTYFHVLEHIVDITALLKEANRVLEEDGYIIIEVPDGSRYHDAPINSGFWFSIREHIYHFSPSSLIAALQTNGFNVELVSQPTLPTPEFQYSSLIIVGKKQHNITSLELTDGNTNNFLLDSYDAIIEGAQAIIEKSQKYKSVLFWGMSNQLFSVLSHLEDIQSKISICDANVKKQGLIANGITVVAPDAALKDDQLLVISSFLHKDAILTNALQLGWDKENIVNLICTTDRIEANNEI